MAKPRLYLFVGYPGAGKTTVAKAIHEATGAVHLWADFERRIMFKTPSHSKQESRTLYDHLNSVADELLAQGKSVIFDTNFNFYKDRQHLRDIAAKHNADTAVIWINTPKETAKQRAVHDRNLRNGYEFPLPEDEFERMTGNVQAPRKEENVIELDGTDLSEADIKQALGL